MESTQYCFVTWVTRNSRVSERMVEFNPSEFIEGLEPIVFGYQSQLIVAELIVDAAKRYELDVQTFNVLPDHIHMLVRVATEEELSQKIGNIKGYVAHQVRLQSKMETKIWAQKFNRQWIQDEKHLANVIRYIDKNHLKHVKSWGREFLCGYGTELRGIVGLLKGK